MKRTNPPAVLSAFTGLGGLDLGLEMAGFATIACIEWDQLARESLMKNRGLWNLLKTGDITLAATEIAPEQFGLKRGELQVLAGGPPCQPYSKAAQWTKRSRRGIRDKRSECFRSFLGLCEKFLPQCLLIENVQGFVTGRYAATGVLARSLAAINREHGTNYKLQHWTINAADYGVPQRRTRAIVFASRENKKLEFPQPTFESAPITAWDAIGNLENESDGPLTSGGWTELLSTIPEGENYLWHTPRGGGQPLFGFRTRFWSFLLKLAKDRPAWTLPAQPGPNTGPFHWDNRRLTVAEMLRLQSFPNDWHVCGSYRDQTRQIGNATPPLLAEVVGRAIMSQIFQRPIPAVLRLQFRRSRRKPPPELPLRAIPSKYQRLIADHPDHPGAGRGPRPVRKKIE